MTREQTLAIVAAILLNRDPQRLYDENEAIEEAADLLGAAVIFIDRQNNNLPRLGKKP